MKILVIGSGPIVIGQAAEFDYAGSQACKSLREEGHEVVLINSNPATIMTDLEMSDALYIEPLTVEFCERVIARERPDALLPTLGGQTGLNLATQLADGGILERYAVKLLGTPLEAIRKAEDRESFRDLMRQIKEPVPESWIIENSDQLKSLLDIAPYPCIIRPAYTLGGTGGGIANSREELWDIGNKGLTLSMRSQVMVERSLLGWKEVEYEVMRDSAGNCITVCNMENFDPMGVHTGDSIVVAPSQTLSDLEYHMLRTASLKIIQALGIEGGCNVQLAVNPESFDYYVIEVNPRVSRSSALASKATGYPIARVAAKIAVGKTLDQIENAVTGTTKACFEPALDYCVVKIPRWPFDKFSTGDRTLFTQMKATGEVMAIDRSFEAALMKAIRGLEVKQKDLRHAGMHALEDGDLREAIRKPTDERLWAVAEGLRRGWTIDEVNRLSRVDKWFLRKIVKLLEAEASPASAPSLVYKMVDTCAGEFESKTPYYYSSEETEDDYVHAESDGRETVLVLGSGPIRIGQGIEFDYSCVHCVWALQKLGYRPIIVNNNPETVSTDFDTGEGLYFEPVTLSDVLQIIDHERPIGVVVQFGGQTAINLATPLQHAGVNVLGTQPDAIDTAEDRDRFERLLNDLDIPKPAGKAVRSLAQAEVIANEIGYPVLVRPSFVLGGRAMEIVYDDQQLVGFYAEAEAANPGQPVLIDKYISGIEAEVDVISDGVDTLVPGIMEHIERAGIHSGDSMAVYPAVTLSTSVQRQMVLHACRMARALGVRGLMNVQFVIQNDTAYVLEVNPRGSRTVPYLSKVTGIPMVDLATRCMMGHTLQSMGFGSGLWVLNDPSLQAQLDLIKGDRFSQEVRPHASGRIVLESEFESGEVELPTPSFFAIKAPVFSFQKLAKVEPSLGPEMKSTGEILGIDRSFEAALYKALIASGIRFGEGSVLLSVKEGDKQQAALIAKQLHRSGIPVAATPGTHQAIVAQDVPCELVYKIGQGEPDVLSWARGKRISLVVNTPSASRASESDGARIRRACIENGIACVTNLDTAMAVIRALDVFADPMKSECLRLPEYFSVRGTTSA